MATAVRRTVGGISYTKNRKPPFGAVILFMEKQEILRREWGMLEDRVENGKEPVKVGSIHLRCELQAI